MGRNAHIVSMWIYAAVIRLLAQFGHAKARGWIQMRQGNAARLIEATEALPRGSRWMWFHCASVGEFEQARPVMEAWRERHPEDAFLLTFYSVSGWNAFARRGMPGWRATDHVSALPLDVPGKVNAYLRAAKGASGEAGVRGMLCAKYDVWPILTSALVENGVATGVFAAHVIPGRWPFRMGGAFQQAAWRRLSMVSVQTETSVELLRSHGIAAEVHGDPRFDRVLQAVEAHQMDSALEQWVGGRPCLVVGSGWAPEMEAALKAWQPGLCAVVVPHEWTAKSIDDLRKKWEARDAQPVVWSVCRGADSRAAIPHGDVLLVDTVGELLGLYAVADIALVGGGFGKGVHNTLEPAAHGAVVLVGPEVGRFREVKELERAGGLVICSDEHELTQQLHRMWSRTEEVRQAGAIAQAYARSSSGAGIRIAAAWENHLVSEQAS